MCLAKRDEIVDKHSKTYQKKSQKNPKPGDLQPSTYMKYGVEHNSKDPKCKVYDPVWIAKYKNIFAKGYIPNSSEEVFVIKEANYIIPLTYVISDFNCEKIVETFSERVAQDQTNRIQNS